jgi:hypothetical protein
MRVTVIINIRIIQCYLHVRGIRGWWRTQLNTKTCGYMGIVEVLFWDKLENTLRCIEDENVHRNGRNTTSYLYEIQI